IQAAVAARHVAVTQDDGLRTFLAGGSSNEITDVRVAGGGGPVGCGFILNIRQAEKNARRAELVGANPEMVRPISRIQTPSIGYRKIPGILIPIVIRPHSY